jgi:hypothetical protein
MGRQGREPNELTPQERCELEDFQPEGPMDSDDATGAPPGRTADGSLSKRYARELAFLAWEYLARHDPAKPLPTWVAEYLREVAGKIVGELGPLGSLSPASARAAIGIVGEQWALLHKSALSHTFPYPRRI